MTRETQSPVAPAPDYAALALQVAADAGLPAHPRDLRPLSGGIANHVYSLRGHYTIRLGTGPDGKCYPKSAALLQAVEGRILAPKVLYTDFTQNRYPWNVMVCTHLPGDSLYHCWNDLSPADHRRILAPLPDQLRVLHSLPWPPLAQRLELVLPAAALQDQLARLFPAAQTAAPPQLLATLRQYVDTHWPAIATAPSPVIIHNDVHWNNILVYNKNFAGLIDFDDAELAWPEVDAMAMVYFLAATEDPHALTPFSRPDSMRRACRIVRDLWPGVFDTPGCLERYLLSQAAAILVDLTEPPPWHTPEESRQEALQVFQALFTPPGPAAWFQP